MPIKTFILFFGYPRSGHSFFAQCLNARRDTLISHEFDVLYHISRNNLTSTQIIDGISYRNNFFCTELDYRWEGYNYKINRIDQLYKNNLICVGDKKGGGTTIALNHNRLLMNELLLRFPKILKLIHYIRNPLDNISTIAFQSGQTIQNAIAYYTDLAEKNEILLDITGKEIVRKIYNDLNRAEGAH